MKIIKIEKGQWAAGLGKAAQAFRLIGPVKEKDFHSFKPLGNGVLPELNFQNSRLSPKSIVYPQSEVMMTYSLDESREDHHLMRKPPRTIRPGR